MAIDNAQWFEDRIVNISSSSRKEIPNQEEDMQTQTKYEEIVLQELRNFPEEVIPDVIDILRSVRKGISVTRRTGRKEARQSGLSGIWKDDRSAVEIIEDIRSRRTGFGMRQVEL